MNVRLGLFVDGCKVVGPSSAHLHVGSVRVEHTAQSTKNESHAVDVSLLFPGRRQFRPLLRHPRLYQQVFEQVRFVSVVARAERFDLLVRDGAELSRGQIVANVKLRLSGDKWGIYDVGVSMS